MATRVPVGPVVQEADGTGGAVWTYQNLLRDSTDEALFDYYFQTQIAIIGLDGSVTPIGPTGVHTAALPSPDGKYLMVRTLHRPYSYQSALQQFPTTTAVWNRLGKLVRTIADTPLQEVALTGRDIVLIGPRDLTWRPDMPATLQWAEALDGGSPDEPADKRDRLLTLAAPFTDAPTTLATLEYRFTEARWAPRANRVFVTETWRASRRTRTWAIDLIAPHHATLLFDRSSQDRYNDPGAIAMAPTERGTVVVRTSRDGNAAYLIGQGSSPHGERPFLDRLDLQSFTRERIWQCEGPFLESVLAVLDDDAARLVTRRESPQAPPNYFVRDRRNGSLRPVTHFADPAPELAGVTPQLLTYTRGDGMRLSATLYLPPGYKSRDGPLPFLLWAYPTDFKDSAAAGQVRGSPYRFSRPGGLGRDHLFALTQGYGVLDDVAMPIVGERTLQPNDTYVEQLVANATAAIEALVKVGVADRDRLAIGGHSYGASMAATLLAHSDLFQAGIARSGAFNRTLTPFGFQNESRTLWQARDSYIRMSPLLWAETLDEPLLIIHGQADSNPGTFPLQSERMFAALKGTSGRARYVQLPYEDHGYRARESVGHVIWEMLRWLDLYVKHRPARTDARTARPPN